MKNINSNCLETLITTEFHPNHCTILNKFDEERYSFTHLFYCADGIGSPEVRGFKNGHYAGIILMPTENNIDEIAYFIVIEGDFDTALDDKKTIMRLIDQNAFFPERRPLDLKYNNEIKRPYQ